jgi:hypothetical protein
MMPEGSPLGGILLVLFLLAIIVGILFIVRKSLKDANKKTLGIVFSVIGLAGGVFAYARLTSLYGQMHSWSPPFDGFEISTILIGIVALVLLIAGIIFWSKKTEAQK